MKVPITFAFPPSACPVSASPYVQGGGSAPVFNAMLMWAAKACKPPLSVQNQYVLDSGPAGRDGFVAGLLDYAVTGQPLTAKQSEDLDTASMRYAYAPLTASAQVFGIRLFDRITRQQIRDIRLTPELLAEMFTGQLTNWNDPRILALNPGHVDSDGNGTLPTKLKAVVRGDASDSSFELTSYFWATARQTYIDGGKDLVGGNPFEKGPTEIFPSTGQILLFQGERSAAREVARPSENTTPDFGYIGAMDSSWAAQYGLATVKIKNSSGNFVDATPAAMGAGLAAMTEGADGFLEPDFNAPGEGVYPLPTVEYALVRHDVGGSFDGTDGLSLKAFLGYAVTDGQVGLPAGYIALPDELVKQTQQAIKAIPDDPTDLGDGDDPPGSVGFGPDVPPTTDGFTTGDDLTASDTTTDDTNPVGSIQRGPVVVAVPLAAVVGRLALPILVIAGTVGLFLGLGMLWTDRRAAKRGDDPEEPGPRKRRFRKDRVPG